MSTESSYSSLGTGQLLDDPVVVCAATEAKMSPARLLLSWAYTLGIPVIPKSTTKARIIANLDVKPLSDKSMSVLAQLGDMSGGKLCWNPGQVV